MKNKYILFWAICIFIIKTTLLDLFTFSNFHPNIILITIVYFSFKYDFKVVFKLAIILGLLQDIFVSLFIGGNILAYILVTFFVCNFETVFNKRSFISPLFLITISTIIYNMIYFVLGNLLGYNLTVSQLFSIVSLGILFNSIIQIIIHRYFFKKRVMR
ncbi:MAG: rod shape-determining protein MreD [Bacillota bacterium]